MSMSKHIEHLADEALAAMEPHDLEDYDFTVGFEECFRTVARPLLETLKEATRELGAFVQVGAGPSTSRAFLAAQEIIERAEGRKS